MKAKQLLGLLTDKSEDGEVGSTNAAAGAAIDAADHTSADIAGRDTPGTYTGPGGSINSLGKMTNPVLGLVTANGSKLFKKKKFKKKKPFKGIKETMKAKQLLDLLEDGRSHEDSFDYKGHQVEIYKDKDGTFSYEISGKIQGGPSSYDDFPSAGRARSAAKSAIDLYVDREDESVSAEKISYKGHTIELTCKEDKGAMSWMWSVAGEDGSSPSKTEAINHAKGMVDSITKGESATSAPLEVGDRMNVDWDGPSEIEVHKVDGHQVHIKRVKKGKVSDDDMDYMVVTKPELQGMIRKNESMKKFNKNGDEVLKTFNYRSHKVKILKSADHGKFDYNIEGGYHLGQKEKHSSPESAEKQAKQWIDKKIDSK